MQLNKSKWRNISDESFLVAAEANGDTYESAYSCLSQISSTLRDLNPIDLARVVMLLKELEEEVYTLKVRPWLDIAEP